VSSKNFTKMAARRRRADNDANWRHPYDKQYHAKLLVFMAWKFNQVFSESRRFSRAHLLSIQPFEVRNFLALKAYKKIDYNKDEDAPTHARSPSIA